MHNSAAQYGSVARFLHWAIAILIIVTLPCAWVMTNSGPGPLQNFLPFNEQQHNIYGVVDFKVGRFDVNAGIGYGLTPGSDRLMGKIIIGTDLTEGETSKPTQGPKSFRKADSLVGGLPRP